MKKVIENTKTLAEELKYWGCNVLTQGTDNHLLLLDLRGSGITGKDLESRLEEVGIISNKNAIPFDTEKKTITSGLRLGTAAVTSRGLNTHDMIKIADIIHICIDSDDIEFSLIKEQLLLEIKDICKKYPLYKD